MHFEWDESKRQSNVEKHGIDFADCSVVFDNRTYLLLDDRDDYGEVRFISIGLLRDIVVVIAHTETDEVIRLISARKANRHEQEAFFRSIGKPD